MEKPQKQEKRPRRVAVNTEIAQDLATAKAAAIPANLLKSVPLSKGEEVVIDTPGKISMRAFVFEDPTSGVLLFKVVEILL